MTQFCIMLMKFVTLTVPPTISNFTMIHEDPYTLIFRSYICTVRFRHFGLNSPETILITPHISVNLVPNRQNVLSSLNTILLHIIQLQLA